MTSRGGVSFYVDSGQITKIGPQCQQRRIALSYLDEASEIIHLLVTDSNRIGVVTYKKPGPPCLTVYNGDGIRLSAPQRLPTQSRLFALGNRFVVLMREEDHFTIREVF